MLRYSKKIEDLDDHALRDMGLSGLFEVLADVTLEKGRGREVVVPDWLSNAVAAGKAEALTHLAGLHIGAHRNGQGLAGAEPLLRKAAEKGYAPAQEQLGIINLFGIGRDAAPGEAAAWLRLAADQGKKEAQSLLGMMLATGTGIERDLPKAQQLLEMAEQQGDGYARLCLHSGLSLGMVPQIATVSLGFLRVLASVLSSLPDDAGDAELQGGIAALADAGDRDASLVLSIMNHSAGNQPEALRWCLAAAGAGNEMAVLIVGLLAFIDHDGIRDMYPAAEWLGAAARQGSTPAQALLGLMYATGRAAERDSSKADRLLGQAAEGMDTSTSFGSLFGSPTKQPYLEAVVHSLGKVLTARLRREGTSPSNEPFNFMPEIMQIAEQGDHFAQFFVGMMLWFGQDVTQDRARAVRWMQEAAGQGNKEAQFFLGICFDAGDGVDRDRKEAIRWFSRAAEQGHTTAQFALAFAYMSGNGVEKDIAEAVRWFRLVAEQGDASAQYHLGMALLEGEGVEQDSAAGVQWLQQSAEQGNAAAQFWTGLCLLEGDGVEEDLRAGIHWLLKAAEQGSQEAIEFLSKMQ